MNRGQYHLSIRYEVLSRLCPVRPKLLGDILDKLELGKHLLLSHALGADGDTGETALGANTDALHGLVDGNALALGDYLGSLLDAGLDDLGILELGLLGSDNTEHDVLALGEESEGLKAAGTGVVIFKEEGVVVEGGEHLLGNLLVGALTEMHGFGEVS